MALCLESLPLDSESKVVYKVKQRPDEAYSCFVSQLNPHLLPRDLNETVW